MLPCTLSGLLRTHVQILEDIHTYEQQYAIHTYIRTYTYIWYDTYIHARTSLRVSGLLQMHVQIQKEKDTHACIHTYIHTKSGSLQRHVQIHSSHKHTYDDHTYIHTCSTTFGLLLTQQSCLQSSRDSPWSTLCSPRYCLWSFRIAWTTWRFLWEVRYIYIYIYIVCLCGLYVMLYIYTHYIL